MVDKVAHLRCRGQGGIGIEIVALPDARLVQGAVAAVEATERAAAEASAREAGTKFANAAREASSAYARNTSAARRAADAARSERDRLLDSIAAAPAASAPAAACGTDDAAGLRQVLRECSGAIQELAAVADEDANRLNALQQWVKEVGAAK